MSGLEHLQALRRWICQSVGGVFHEAADVVEPAGTSPGWQALCARMGVSAIDDAERAQVRAAQKPLRGVPVMEFAAVMKAVVHQARQSLAMVNPHAGGVVESTYEQVRIMLDRTERESVAAYKRAVLPKPRGMFDHVLDSKSQTPAFAGGANILYCRTCGAPQLQEREVVCPFCGNHVSET
jgi:hypothetical protein